MVSTKKMLLGTTGMFGIPRDILYIVYIAIEVDYITS